MTTETAAKTAAKTNKHTAIVDQVRETGHCDHCDTDLTAEEDALAVDTDLGERVCAGCQATHAADGEHLVSADDW